MYYVIHFQDTYTNTTICEKTAEPVTFESYFLSLQFISDSDGITGAGYMIDYFVDAPSVDGEGKLNMTYS